MSEPVETQFGWHVIRLNETRLAEAPPLEAVRDELAEELQRAAIDARIAELTDAGEVDRAAGDELGPFGAERSSTDPGVTWRNPKPVSPLAPAAFPDLPVVKGVRFAAAEAGVRYTGRPPMSCFAVLDPGATVAGVFTRSKTRSAPVLDCEAKLGPDRLGGACPEGAAFLVNSGNANAFTGPRGREESVVALCRAVSAATGVPQGRVFTSSTGVIGERLPHGPHRSRNGQSGGKAR